MDPDRCRKTRTQTKGKDSSAQLSTIKSKELSRGVKSLCSPYTTKQATGKSLKGLRYLFSLSPRKQKIVIAKLTQEVGVEIKTAITRNNGNNLSSVTKALVQEFYNSNDISWQVAGRKYFIVIHTLDQDGKKAKQTSQ